MIELRHKNIACDFVFDSPFALYMRDFIDTSTSLVDSDVEISFSVIGATELARAVFLTSAETNIFVTRDKRGKFVQNRVKCHIFDGGDDFFAPLSDGYYRFAEEFFERRGNALFPKRCECDYLPFPEYPTVDRHHGESIGSPEFFAALDVALGLGEPNGKKASFVAVCTDDERKNVELVREILRRKDARAAKNLVVFPYCNASELPSRDDCRAIRETGSGSRFAERAALYRNIMYSLEYNGATDEATHARIVADERASFAKKSQFERDLGTYACLSLRHKLILCGMEIADGGCVDALSEREYLERYERGGARYDPKSGVFDMFSRRNIMAVQEHFRWNAHMLVCGFVPSDRSTILNETEVRSGKTIHTNGKSFAERRHGNLTTFDGLFEFATIVSERDGMPIESADVVKYDFQIMDGAYQLLDECGLKIVQYER